MKKIAFLIMSLYSAFTYAEPSTTAFSNLHVKNKVITKFSAGSIDQSSFFCIKYDNNSSACSVKGHGHYGYAYNSLFTMARTAYLLQLPVDMHIETNVLTNKELAEHFGTANVNTDEIRSITY